jgi:hypothetical protein
MTPRDKPGRATRDPVAIWDDILDLVAEDDAEIGVASDDDVRWSQHVDAQVKSRIAALRRQFTPTVVPIQHGVTIPPAIQAMDRRALVAQLEALRQGGHLRYAHHDLTGLSDTDLRTMLAIAMGPPER